MMRNHLDERMVPRDIAPVLPAAERWGIADDCEREEAIRSASFEELEQIAHCLDGIEDAILVGWLTGPESERAPPSEEYLAITCLTMAVHSAKAKLKKHARASKPGKAGSIRASG